MATRFSNTLAPDATNDAHLREWAQFIEDTFVSTGGWVVTADTGQTLPSALVHPTVQTTKVGYRIYRMNDALQLNYPVFLRMDYGSGGGPPPMPPGLWVTIGTGSDGSGGITGTLLSNQSFFLGVNSYSATPVGNSYGSAFHGRCCFALFVTTNNLYPFFFGIERSRDSDGNETGDGLLLAYSPQGGGGSLFRYSRYVIRAVQTQPFQEDGVSFILTNKNPSEVFAPGDIGLGVLIHFKGVSQQPGLNWLFCNSLDMQDGASISTQLYGSLKTYQHLTSGLQVTRALTSSNYTDTNVRVLMRYD
jgi:hypothetical protein